jgi:hypothetical protein
VTQFASAFRHPCPTQTTNLATRSRVTGDLSRYRDNPVAYSQDRLKAHPSKSDMALGLLRSPYQVLLPSASEQVMTAGVTAIASRCPSSETASVCRTCDRLMGNGSSARYLPGFRQKRKNYPQPRLSNPVVDRPSRGPPR